MEYFASRWQDYHPILVGVGCLALGYMYGRHCKSMVENHHIHHVPMELDATCNHVVGHTIVEPERVTTVQELASSPSGSALNYLDRSIGMTPERIGKRTMGQLEILQMSRNNEGALWTQFNAFKKQKGVPIITIQRKEPIVQCKANSTYDSDDEILAKRLEYFTNQSASINKPCGSNHVLKLGKKKKKKNNSTTKVTTMISKGKDLDTMNSQKSLSKTSTRSRSGLCDLANLQGECSLEDTCKSPKTTMCLENSIQAEENNSAHFEALTKPMPMRCAQALELEYAVSNLVEEHFGDDNADLMDSQCELNEPINDLDHTMGEHDEEERLENVRTNDSISCEEDRTVVVESLEEKVPTSQPTKFHVQERCPMEVKREVKKEHEVPMDKVLKVEIYELLHAADCAKVSFQEIVSVLEEKLKVVLQEDKAHIISLVREVISISKLLEEEKTLEGLEKVEGTLNVCC